MRDAVEMLRKSRRIFAASHIDPDGDAIGSLLGFTWIMRALGKSVTPAMSDAVPWRFQDLPGASDIAAAKPSQEHDLLVALDASELSRVGSVLTAEDLGGRPLLVIDHHVTNSRFGTANFIDPSAASTAEMVYLLGVELGAPIDNASATCLLTGVVTDTLGFRTTNTTPRVLEVAQHLMQAGANLPEISRRAFNSQTYASLCLTAEALHNMQMEDGVVWTELTQEMLKRLDIGPGDWAGIVGQLASVREADAAVVFREREDGRIDISMRSKPGLNLAPVALSLGGGGHPQAAGATLPPPMSAVSQRVVGELKRAVAAHRAETEGEAA
ncbi:MAG: bifunctional oligoribonuclease/PAP phosphatase NrnA [Anaerolineae bacterium]